VRPFFQAGLMDSDERYPVALPDRDEALRRLRAALIAWIGGEPLAGAGVPRRPRPPSRPDSAAAPLPTSSEDIVSRAG
jgi:hypothetical protein